MRNWWIIICAVVATTQVFGQSYPEDREKFVKTFNSLTNEYLSKEQKDFIKDELSVSLIKTSDFPDAYFKQMVATCNLMESKRLKAYPEIFNYVFSVHSFIKNKQPQTSYAAWHSSVDKLLDARNIKKFEDFIELSAGFFSENRIAESTNSKWYYYGAYTFEFTDRPLIRLTDGRLVCGFPNKSAERKDARFLDSVVVYHTSGLYDPVLKKWDGKGGTLDWLKVGLDAKQTFVEMGTYDVSMKTNTFSADSVKLVTPFFPGKKILGKVNDKAFRIIREEDKNFPQFISYEKRLSIKSIREGMDYVGGFSLEGASLIGVGNPKTPAQLTVLRNGKAFIVARSQYITFSPEKVSSNNASITMYVAEVDSLFHPGLFFNYNQAKDLVELTRGKSGVSQAPFSDSYHQLDWYVPKVTWERKATDLLLTYEFGTSQEQRVARLESKSFYDGRLYDRLQGLEKTHPLAAIANYCYKYDIYDLDEGQVATAMSKTIEQAKPLMLELAGYGFISYDVESKKVTVNPKLDNFIKARSGKQDYDNLMFVSDMRPKQLEGVTEEEIAASPYLQRIREQYKKQTEERRLKTDFGLFSLSSMEIKLDAVDRVGVSEAQAAFVLPDDGKIVVRKNRDFDFTGWASVGKMETHTLNANYSYEKNKINLLKTDRSTFRIKPLSQADGNKSIALKTNVNNITGEILIDAPNNRAGLDKTIHTYPILKSTKTSKVYYNDPSLYRGAYDSIRFYFTVEPFEMDSLDNFSEKAFRLKGELTSAGIFPVFKEELKVMADYSLGFATKAPETGYVFYGTKAKYENKIVLSNNGLQGSGKIEFVQSISDSKAFTFLPDSTVGYAQFTNKLVETGTQFPDVTSPDAYITYVPKNNVLKAQSTLENELTFFKGESKLKGTAIIRPTGMTGSGIMLLSKANLGSDNFKFKAHDIDADTAIFNLKNQFQEEGEDPLAFKTENVTAHVSFVDRKGEFKSNNGESVVTFPVNQYVCKMDVFTWLMDKDEVELSSKEKQADIAINTDLNLVGSNFFSIHPNQDSLQFRAPKANFSMKEKTIYCSKTEFIDVADARIYPDSMKVTIRKKAQIDPLVNSRIVANYVTKYHTFINANTEIKARRKYEATGEYPYYDADSTKTLIRMDKISVDSSFQTLASGMVKSESNFKLSKQFDYYGKIDIKASNPLIFFSGATRINHNCDKFAKNWMSFTAQIDPKNIQIPVSDKMLTLNGEPIAAGIIWRDSKVKDSIALYPAFLSSLETNTDPIFMTASGLLQYDFAAKEFQIGSPQKLLNRNDVGNFIALHTESCSLNGDGILNLGFDYGDVTVDAVGTVNYNQETGETTVNSTMRFNLPMDKGAFEGVAERIVAFEGSKPLSFENTNIEQALLTWSDRKTADKIKSDYTLSEDKKIKRVPDAFEKSIVVTGIRLKSIPLAKDQNGLMSSLDGAAIVNLYGKPVMRQVVFHGFFEQNYSLNGDHFAIQMQVPAGPDYLLDYSMIKRDGIVNIVTSDPELSGALNAIKEDKRKTKNFLYQIATNSVYLGKLNAVFE